MNLRKSLFGGYKRYSVDAIIGQLIENEEHVQAKIILMEKEYKLSKENAQKSIESLQAEIVAGQKSMQSMTKIIEERNSRITQLETKQRMILDDFGEQNRMIISREEEKYKTRVTQIEDEYITKARDLEDEYKQKTRFIQQKEDQVKKIGQLYVDAQEYIEKMKTGAKAKTAESIDLLFIELNKIQEQYETSFGQISQKKNSFKQLLGELLDTLHVMQNEADRLDYDNVNFTSSFDNMKYTKEQIKRQVQDEFDIDYKPSYEEIPPKPMLAEKTQKEKLQIDYASQIDELRQKIEKQEELFRLREIETSQAADRIINNEPINIEEPVIIEDRISINENYIGEDCIDNNENSIKEDHADNNENSIKEDHTDNNKNSIKEDRSENNENYIKYFAELEKKYCKEKQPVSYEPEFSVKTPEILLTEDFSDISEEDTDSTMPKMPSIKEILNKYVIKK